MNPRFYFAVGQAGAEPAVKAEVLAEFPRLRFAFSRPGFITFKDADPADPALDSADPALDSADPAPAALAIERGIFTRLWGEVLGQAKDPAALAVLAATIPAGAVVQAFERDERLPGDEPVGFVPGARVRAALEGMPGAHDAHGTVGAVEFPGAAPARPLRPGEPVYSFIWVDEGHVFLGRHAHSERLSGQPGNAAVIPLPAESPSRAYLKIEEAILRFKPEAPAGRRVLEVGCAPGGATTALLNRGLRVTGVDPQFMDKAVAARSGFDLVRKPARFVTADDLRNCNPDWLAMDMSIAPLEALDELGHILSLLRKLHRSGLALRSGFLTLKLNDWSFAASIPLYLKRIEQLGFSGLVPLQLCANRQEFFVWAPRFRA
jgi:23S rRNA (cytidine2498-2'-O)-methyltransferase